jgi:hypothetical protein
MGKEKQPKITFKVWFLQRKFPDKYFKAMSTFTNTQIPRTKEEWDNIYSKY